MSEDTKSWIVDGFKGTSLLAILVAVASGAWLLAEMNGQIQSVRALLETQQSLNIGTRLTAAEMRIETVIRDLSRMEKNIDHDMERLNKRLSDVGKD